MTAEKKYNNPALNAVSDYLQTEDGQRLTGQVNDTVFNTTPEEKLNNPNSSLNTDTRLNEQKMANATRDYRDDIAKLGEGPTKKEQQQRFIAGIGDAISGFAGLISAARGGQAVNTNGNTAMGRVMDDQEKRRLERRKQIEEYYNNAQSEYKMERERLADRRQRLKDERDYNMKRQQEDRKAEYEGYRNQEAKAKAERAGIQAQNQDALDKSQINRNNRSGVKTTTPKLEQETTYHGGGRSFKIKASNQKQAISAAIAAINADDGFEARTKNAQDVFNEYLQSGRAKDNPAFWEAIGPYIQPIIVYSDPEKKSGGGTTKPEEERTIFD